MAAYSFAFREEPFGIDPDARFFYRDAPRQYVYAHLVSSICQWKGPILLTGERGVGKTIVLRHLVDELKSVHGVFLLHPSGLLSCESGPSFHEVVGICRSSFGLSDEGSDREDDEGALAPLLALRNAADVPAVLIVDDAENLSEETLGRLLALSAPLAGERTHLSVVLAGNLAPPMGLSTSAFEMAQHRAHLSLRLQRFQDRDVEPYIAHRMTVAGRDGPPLFTSAAIGKIFRHSRGNPLSINRICRSALVLAGAEGSETVSAEMIDRVAAGGANAPSGPGSEAQAPDAAPIAAPTPAPPASVKMGDGEDSGAETTGSRGKDDGSPPLAARADGSAASPEDAGEKFAFREGTRTRADKVNEIAALARISGVRPLEEYVPSDASGGWSGNRVSLLLRSVWIVLAFCLVTGLTGVYLSQTGRQDATGLVRDWLALLTGQDDGSFGNGEQGPQLAGMTSSPWVPPSNIPDRAPPTASGYGASVDVTARDATPQPSFGTQPSSDTGPQDQSADDANPAGALEGAASPPAEEGTVPSAAATDDAGPTSAAATASAVEPETRATTKGAAGGSEPDRITDDADAVARSDAVVDLETAAGRENAPADPEPAPDRQEPAANDDPASPSVITGPLASPPSQLPIEDATAALDSGDADRGSTVDAQPASSERAAGSAPAGAGNGLGEISGLPSTSEDTRIFEGMVKDAASLDEPSPSGADVGAGDQRGNAIQAAASGETAASDTARHGLPAGSPAGSGPTAAPQPEGAPAQPPRGVVAPAAAQPHLQIAEAGDLDLDRLIARGDEYFALGDVASARLFYRLAAARGSARGTAAMGSTFDPVYLERFEVLGVHANATEAATWYRKALDMGYSAAGVLLRDLVTHQERAAELGDRDAARALEDIRK